MTPKLSASPWSHDGYVRINKRGINRAHMEVAKLTPGECRVFAAKLLIAAERCEKFSKHRKRTFTVEETARMAVDRMFREATEDAKS